jgi:dolichol-phosphate mannosyltransferase
MEKPHVDLEPSNLLVVIPTYNESGNIRSIVRLLHESVPTAQVLVVDDDSPDGTGDLAEAMARRDGRVNVLHRTAKSGLGAAYLAGFAWALARHFEVVVEMDADGSHSPQDLPKMLAALSSADLVLGSRWVPGGVVLNWPRSREVLSRGGNRYARLALGVPTRDLTGGYRAYRRSVLEGVDLAGVSSQGYCFQIDLAWRAMRAGFIVSEVPITFSERVVGESKMSRRIVAEALFNVSRWGLTHRARQLLGLDEVRPPTSAASVLSQA